MSPKFATTSTASHDVFACRQPLQTVPVAIHNRPGLPEISYRCGTHARFKHSMLSRLSTANRKALSALTTRADDDFTIALLDAFAVMSDVLTFYQERIAQESYLRTATERFSILHLARLVGYKPKPGLAAQTHLAFTLDHAEGSPQTVDIPERTQAQSIPKEQKQLPQTFETTEAITARVEWNELRPRMTRAQKISMGNQQVFLKGANLNLRTGDVLLFMDNDLADETEGDHHNKWNIVRITKSEPQPEFDRTLVTWNKADGDSEFLVNNSLEADQVAVYVFRERANVFGFNAPDWRALPDAGKATYLGIADPGELTVEELVEWPNFVIQAPIFPLYDLRTETPTRDVPATPESVARAVTAVADAAAEAMTSMAITSVPNAAIQVMLAIKAILDAIFDVAKGISSGIQGSIDNYPNRIDETAEIIKEIFASLFSLESLDDVPLQKFKDLIDALTKTVMAHPTLSPFEAVIDILASDTENPLDKIGEALEKAAKAIDNVPESFAKAAGGHIVAKVVTMAVKAIMVMPIFKTDDVDLKVLIDDPNIDFSSIKGANLSLTPELVAFTAIVSAKMALAVLAGLNITEPQVLYDTIFTSTWERDVDGNGQIQIKPDEDAVFLENLATGIIGAAASGFTALMTANILLLSFVWPAIIPVIIPIFIGYILFAKTLGDDVFDGAKETQVWICKVAKAALNIKKEVLSPRRALKKLSTHQIDLDKIYSQVTPGSWLLLSLPDSDQMLPNSREIYKEIYKVSETAEASRSDFNLNAKVTRVTLNGSDFTPKGNAEDENDFRKQVRMTSVFANSEKLQFSEEPDTCPIIVGRANSGNTEECVDHPINCVTLDQRIPELEIGRRLILTGLSDDEDVKQLIDLLTLRKQGENDAGPFSELKFHKRDGEIKKYKRDSVRIFANVAPATHGATVEEILGSGDASTPFQTFELRQPPVTHVASSATTGSTSTLEVRVNDVRWEEVPFLHDTGPHRRVFSSAIDDAGKTTVRFGDGLDGARPHTGLENIRARYCSGLGSEGNVGAGDIALLTRHPPGVVQVSNLRPATSGSDPESLDDVRRHIPSPTRLLERIVSLRDYEGFALVFPDVCKALAVQRGFGPNRGIQVTVAGNAGAAIEDDRLEELRDAMHQDGDPYIPIQLANYRHIEFVLAAQITYGYDYTGESVAAAVRSALETHFAFDSRQLGQPVTLVEIMALIQGVGGVTAVDVDLIYRTDQTGPSVPQAPGGLTIVNAEGSPRTPSAAVDSEETELKPAFILPASSVNYTKHLENYREELTDDLMASPDELLLPRKIALWFQNQKDDRT